MLHITNISKSYGATSILSDISFQINQNERAGLVGPNGCGKTTLMRMIMGNEAADKGAIQRTSPAVTIGYLAQALQFTADDTLESVLYRATIEHRQAWAEMEACATKMSQVSDEETLAQLTEAYAEAEARFEAAGGHHLNVRVETVLAGLKLAEVSRIKSVAKLSGGQKTRLGLVSLLVKQPDLLLLDEPTNHLDIEALTWLEAWLRDYKGSLLIASHDRAFLDAVTTRTLVIDAVQRTLRDFSGNYTAYTETIAHEAEQQWQAYKNQQDEIAQLRGAAQQLRGQAKFKRGGKADTADKFAKGHFANRSAGTVHRAKHIEKRIEKLLTEERIDKPERQWHLRVNFADDKSGARQVLTLSDVSMAFGHQVLFRNVSLTLTHSQRVALIGPNGTGKTTLLRLITQELAPTTGMIHLGQGVKLGYLAQEQEFLEPDQTPYDVIRATSEQMSQSEIRNFLHHFLFKGDEVFVKIGSLSYGERTRLMLALLVAQGCNFLILDEPTNHLDISGREQVEQALLQFPGTILAVVHDRAFIQQIATEIWHLDEGSIIVRPDLPSEFR